MVTDDRLTTLLAEGVSNETQWILIAVGSAFVAYILMRPWLQGKRKRTSDPLADQPFRTSLSQQKALERDMQNLLVELHGMARQMSAQIETRVAKLELLLEEADTKIALLEGRTGAADAPSDPVATAMPRADRVDRPPLRLASTDGPNDLGDEATADSEAAAFDQPTRAAAAATLPAVSTVPAAAVDRYAELYQLADQGLDARAIAARVQRPAGEIELILALRPRVRAAPDAPDVEVTEPPAIASA